MKYRKKYESKSHLWILRFLIFTGKGSSNNVMLYCYHGLKIINKFDPTFRFIMQRSYKFTKYVKVFSQVWIFERRSFKNIFENLICFFKHSWKVSFYIELCAFAKYRWNLGRCSIKKLFLKIHRKHLCPSLFFNEVIKKETPTPVFSCDFYEIFKVGTIL